MTQLRLLMFALIFIISSVIINADSIAISGVIIDNGDLIQLGIHPEGHLNVPGGTHSMPSSSTSNVGLRYIPTNGEATAPGCLCEGWGVANADDSTGVFSGYANVDSDNGVVNLNVQADTGVYGSDLSSLFESVGSHFRSVVTTGHVYTGEDRLRITHNYHPSATHNLYEVDVTIENIGNSPVGDLRYRRVMDWDIAPNTFNEWVEIHVGDATDVIRATSDGFMTANPLLEPDPYAGFPPTVIVPGSSDYFAGPADQGASFDFGFGNLNAGASKKFKIYYGAAETRDEALNALQVVGAEVYSFGISNDISNQASLNGPHVFIFAFKGVGGTVVPGTAIELVDPVTELLSTDQMSISANYDSLSIKGVIREGVATDGTTKLVIRFETPETGTVLFSLEDEHYNSLPVNGNEEYGFLTDVDEVVNGSEITVNTDTTSNGKHYGFVVYNAPEQFVRNITDETSIERQVFIKAHFYSDTGNIIDVLPRSIRIVRPPVLLVHGIWSDMFTWDNFKPLITDTRFFIKKAAYRNDREFVDGADMVFKFLKRTLDLFKDSYNVAAVQADVVAHSMGAPVVRTMALRYDYLYNGTAPSFGKGPVRRLITIGGVHKGSAMANFLLSNQCLQDVFTNDMHKNTGNGAVADLEENSTAIQLINNIQTPFPVHTIVGLTNSAQKTVNEAGINWEVDRKCDGNLFTGFDDILGQDNDLMVSARSQRGGQSAGAPTVTDYENVIHSDPFFPKANRETLASLISERVVELLNSNDSSLFAPLP